MFYYKSYKNFFYNNIYQALIKVYLVNKVVKFNLLSNIANILF